MFFNAFLELKNLKKDHRSDIYWVLALSALMTSNFSFSITPITTYFFLTIANSFNLAAMICIALLFRSWNTVVTKRLEITVFLLLLVFGLVFEYSRVEENYLARTYIVIGGLMSIGTWQLTEIWLMHQKNKSIHLKFIFLIIATQILIMCLRLTTPPAEIASSVKNIFEETGHAVIIRMAWSSSFLLLLIFISNYFYEQLLISERNTVNELEEKKVKLLARTKENNEIKALLEERSALINSLILANKTAATGALSASIAHELNQPITAIQLNSDYLKTAISNEQINPSSLKEIIEDIQYDNQRSAIIIRTLKDIFQHHSIETKPTNLNIVIQNIIPVIEPKIRLNNIQLELMLQATSMIRLNKSEFQQVILNLVNNAIDALSNLQNTDKKITIRTREKNNYLEFSVIDNGIGVPKELEASIFMLMKTNKQTGMGLGLWLSKHIVDRHNGQISYQKTQSGCIEFLIRLPLNLEY
jgi:C4-dicarboxylate-specific signal transduction histidine kinase